MKQSNNATTLSYSSFLWKRFRKNKLALWSLRIFYGLLFVAVFADFIANERPIYCQVEGETHFPIFRNYLVQAGLTKPAKAFLHQDWKEIKYEKAIFAPIPYSPNTLDTPNRFKSPAKAGHQHYFGTGELGRDVAAGLIHGTRIALMVGILAMLLASSIGIFLGSLAGYFGDSRFRISKARLWLNVLGLPLGLFYGFITRHYALSEAGREGGFGTQLLLSIGIIVLIFLVLNGLTSLLKRIPFFQKKVAIPLDLIVMRLVEIFNSIPSLLFLLAIIAIVQKSSIYNILLIIGFLGWTGIARFVRAELLRIRSLQYIDAVQSMGLSDVRILLRHALPNSLTPVLIRIAFGIAAAILFEAALSFLGIGVGVDDMTWGKLLAYGRSKPSAWWLAIFPGLAIFVSVLVFNLIGEGLTDALNPKRRK